MGGQQPRAPRPLPRRDRDGRAQPGGRILNLLDAQSIIDAAGAWVVLIVTLVILLETAVLPASFLPGDSLLFVTGLTVATVASPVPTWAAFVLIAAAAVLGAQASYELGRAAGPTIMRRPRRWPFTDEVYDRTVALFERLGVRAVIVARFVPIVRALIPLIAGFTRMSRRRFVLVNVAGAVAWVVLFMGAGFLLGGLPAVQQNLELAILIAILASSLPFPIELAREWWMRRRARRAAEAAPLDSGG